MGEAIRIVRYLCYRDDRGETRYVRVESTDPLEVERVARLYGNLERVSAGRERLWRERHETFTDLGVRPNGVAEAVESGGATQGFPWEGPRFSFAILLGESATWAGQASLWAEVNGEVRCRCCGHLRELPPVACCLNGECNRTGRDAVIPRPTTYDLRRREEKAAEPTKVPPPARDRAGRVLLGGLAGKK